MERTTLSSNLSLSLGISYSERPRNMRAASAAETRAHKCAPQTTCRQGCLHHKRRPLHLRPTSQMEDVRSQNRLEHRTSNVEHPALPSGYAGPVEYRISNIEYFMLRGTLAFGSRLNFSRNGTVAPKKHPGRPAVSRVLFPRVAGSAARGRRPFIWAAHCWAAHSFRNSGLPAVGPESRHRPLLGLAPGGVCRAGDVAIAAVRSYRTISPLPAPAIDGGSRDVSAAVGRAVSFLWHCPCRAAQCGSTVGVTHHRDSVVLGLSSSPTSGEAAFRRPTCRDYTGQSRFAIHDFRGGRRFLAAVARAGIMGSSWPR
jgi:hypothetical protein